MPEKTHPAPLRLATFLPFRLSVLSNAVSQRIAELYDREFGLSIWQWRVLAVLGETDALTSTEVAERTFMDKPSVSRTAASLIERDLIPRQTDSIDRRRAPLSLTQAGRAIYLAITPRALDCERALLSALSPQDTAQLQALLTRLAGAVSPARPLWTES